MRKERTLELVAFLARLVLRTARDKRIAFHVAALIDHERRHRFTALHAGNGPGTASVNHGNLHVGTERVNAVTQILPGVRLFAKAESLFVGVAAVINQHLVASIGRTVFKNLGIEIREFLLQRSHGRLTHENHVLRLHTAHFFEHLRKRAGIAFGIAQHRTARAAIVRAHGNHIAVDASRFRRRVRRIGIDSQKHEHQD